MPGITSNIPGGTGDEFTEAIRKIDDYLIYTFGEGLDLNDSDFSDISIIEFRTHVGSDVVDSKASIDLINYNVIFSACGDMGEQKELREYNSLRELIDDLDTILCFDATYSILIQVRDDYIYANYVVRE